MKPSRCLVFFSVLAAMAAAEPSVVPPPLPGSTPPAAPPAAVTPALASTPASGNAPAAGTAAASSSVFSKLKLPPDASKTKEAIKPAPLSPRFQQVRDRMNALFQNRSEPPPSIDPAKNPFRAAGAPPPPVAIANKDGAPASAPPPIITDLELLKQGATQLKVNGFVERDGRTLLTINQALYREGDVIKVTVKGQAVYLRVSKLSRTSLTLTLNAAETTLKF
jgi:hypothetical protein